MCLFACCVSLFVLVSMCLFACCVLLFVLAQLPLYFLCFALFCVLDCILLFHTDYTVLVSVSGDGGGFFPSAF